MRRAFASTTSAPAYSYDPYGNPLQTTAPVTDFVYAGMFYNADSGLYLTQYRAYDPIVGRWLSRDPLGENNDPAANLYRYADGNPIGLGDPAGLWGVGVIGSASAEVGIGAGVATTTSIGAGAFWGGLGGPNVGSFFSFGAFAGAPGFGAGIPNCPQEPPANGVLGRFAGAGRGGFLTNAISASQLAGPFNMYSLDVGPASIQYATSGNVWILSVTVGPGGGGAVAAYPTYTVVGP